MKKLVLLFTVLLSYWNLLAGDISPLCGIWEAKSFKPHKYRDLIYIYEVCGSSVKGFTYDQDKNGGFCLYRIEGIYNHKTKKLRAECTAEVKVKNHVPPYYRLYFKDGLFGKQLKGVKTTSKTSLPWQDDNIKYKQIESLEDLSSYAGETYLIKSLEKKYSCGCIDEEKDGFAEDKRVATRQNKNIKTVESNAKRIKIKLKDGNKVDGDKVSVFLNGKKIYSGIEVGRLSKTLKFRLPKQLKENEIIFVADNLGDIPPNTAEIKVIVGIKTYKLLLNCDMETNNVIEIKKSF